MKKIQALLTFVTILAIAPSILAGNNKPPDRLCLELESGSIYHHLSIDKGGKIYDKSHGIKTHVITGSDQYGTVTGSGYVARGTSILIATYNGMHSDDTLSNYQLKFNIKTKSGTIYYRFDDPAQSTPHTGSETVYKTGCQSLNLPPVE